MRARDLEHGERGLLCFGVAAEGEEGILANWCQERGELAQCSLVFVEKIKLKKIKNKK